MDVLTKETTNDAGLTSNVLPEVPADFARKNSHTGVSTNSAHTQELRAESLELREGREGKDCGLEVGEEKDAAWYVLRATYGREKVAYKYLQQNNIKAFYPTIITKKVVNDKLKKTEESMLPNLFFAYSTFNELKEHVYDNFHDETKYLRFYYAKHHDGTKEPLIVPEKQMKSLMIICGTESDNIIIQPEEVEKFKEGQHVIVKEGDFKGVEGVVARYHGQQRVGIIIKGLMTATTAYIPSAFLKKLEDQTE